MRSAYARELFDMRHVNTVQGKSAIFVDSRHRERRKFERTCTLHIPVAKQRSIGRILSQEKIRP